MFFLDIAAAFLTAALAGMGVGGGGLLVIYLTLAREMPQLEAQGINLLFFLSSALPAIAVNLKKRRLDFRRILLTAAPGALFAVLGALLASKINAAVLRKVFGGLMILAGAGAFAGGKKPDEKQENKTKKSR